MPKTLIEPGIYFDLPADEYFAADGLSNSGIKQLAVSPLWYWHNNLNPDFVPPEESYPQRIGKAVHCRLLEPQRFDESYAVKPSQDDFPGVLVTVEDMKAWLAGRDLPTSAKRKQELIDRIKANPTYPPIWDEVLEVAAEENAGKVLLDDAEAQGIERLVSVVDSEPVAKALLTGGMPEVSFFVRDPETGVMLKARMDYVRAGATIDLKTFSNSRGKPTDKVVFDAIFYEGYYVQAVFYHRVRELARKQLAAGEIKTHGLVSEAWIKVFAENAGHGFGFVFVESAEPFDLRVIELRSSEAPGGDQNVYWTDAEIHINERTRQYASCVEKYGEAPWRDLCQPRLLEDTDIPQLIFSGRAA